MLLVGLGRLLDAAFNRTRNLIERIAGTPTERVILASLASAHVEGSRIAYAYHGGLLGFPRAIPPSIAREAGERAARHALRFNTALLERIEAERVTQLFVRSTAALAVRQGVWGGHDTQARAVAAFAGADFKRWVRAFPRRTQRDHHDAMEGVLIPTEEKFILPGGRNSGARVYGPRAWDDVPDPGEWLNCGHALEFLTNVTQSDLEPTRRALGTIYTPGRA